MVCITTEDRGNEYVNYFQDRLSRSATTRYIFIAFKLVRTFRS